MSLPNVAYDMHEMIRLGDLAMCWVTLRHASNSPLTPPMLHQLWSLRNKRGQREKHAKAHQASSGMGFGAMLIRAWSREAFAVLAVEFVHFEGLNADETHGS